MMSVIKLGAPMDASREDVPACMDFPGEPWAQIAGADPPRRRADDRGRRRMDRRPALHGVESLARIADAETVRPSPVAT